MILAVDGTLALSHSFHIRIVPSSLPDAKSLPLGLNVVL